MTARAVEVVEAAAVGDRITHKSDLPDAQVLDALRKQLGQLSGVLKDITALGSSRRGGARSAVLGSALTRVMCQSSLLTVPPCFPGSIAREPLEAERCPSPSGSIVRGSEDTFIGREIRGAALVDHEPVDCDRHVDQVVATGSATVFVNDLPWARRMDETGCGALIGEGEATVWLPAQPTTDKGSKAKQAPHQASVAGAFGAQVGAALSARVSKLLPSGQLSQAMDTVVRSKRGSLLANLGALFGHSFSRTR